MSFSAGNIRWCCSFTFVDCGFVCVHSNWTVLIVFGVRCFLQDAAAPLMLNCLMATGTALMTPCLLAASALASATAQVRELR